MPISRAMARSDIASGPLATSSRRAVWMISSMVAARSRSRRDGGCTAPGSVPALPSVSQLPPGPGLTFGYLAARP